MMLHQEHDFYVRNILPTEWTRHRIVDYWKKDIVYILITDHSSYKVSNKGLLTEYLHNVKHIDDGIWSITIFAT